MSLGKVKRLNKEQLKAVRYSPPAGGGPLLIIAGAGTGKTTVIAERIKYLISKKITKPIKVTYIPEFKRNLRALAKKYRHIRPDVEPVINQIEAGVTPSIQGLKSVGFNDSHFRELIELDGLSDTGEVIIRNATSGALKHVQLLNFQE